MRLIVKDKDMSYLVRHYGVAYKLASSKKALAAYEQHILLEEQEGKAHSRSDAIKAIQEGLGCYYFTAVDCYNHLHFTYHEVLVNHFGYRKD